jgi:hypothetical protein
MVLSSVIMGQFSFRYGLPPEIAVAAASFSVQRSAASSTAGSSR